MDDNNPFAAANRLNEITRDLDERGLVLTLAAFAEEALGGLLSQFMRPGKAANALLEGFNAPLGTFSARTKAAFSLGLLTKRQYENLERLRQMRNEFAHSWEPVTFDDKAVAAHIAALHYTPLVSDFPTTKISKVRACISSALVEIGSTTNQIRVRGNAAQIVGSHLIPGVIEEEHDRVASCELRLADIESMLQTAEGEHREYLAAQRERWLGLLTIYTNGASGSEKVKIAKLLQKYGPFTYDM